MARPTPKPCAVPGCKGRIEFGTHPDGSRLEWCFVCERRIAQLRALQERPPMPTISEATDAQLMKFVQDRTWNLSQVEKHTKRSANVIRAAIKSGELPSARVGRYGIVPREAAKTWAENYQRRSTSTSRTLVNISTLPRESSKAITVEQWASVAKKSAHALATWARDHAKDPRLKICATLSPKRRPMLAYWWEEAAHA